ncbi:BON domain-containing protein [Chondromyces apiculatus]|uniref:Putative periplasmic or secreted lipoprotein n=1 Tax=Chondromyces apiculatus DSM 436 TaxID=1192034 RepID=A0A017T758_9BACT|nr:BON domain-containing protein [Chondromyces apiculatus]EYF04630.1 putative periplasmic or secreted lipoprotein [Chondromyces apiculatus DSM 436]
MGDRFGRDAGYGGDRGWDRERRGWSDDFRGTYATSERGGGGYSLDDGRFTTHERGNARCPEEARMGYGHGPGGYGPGEPRGYPRRPEGPYGSDFGAGFNTGWERTEMAAGPEYRRDPSMHHGHENDDGRRAYGRQRGGFSDDAYFGEAIRQGYPENRGAMARGWGGGPSEVYHHDGEYGWSDQPYRGHAHEERGHSAMATLKGAMSDLGDKVRGFFGRGPKGYKRSDERIHEDVCEALSDRHDVDASEVTVQVKDGEVTLVGTVHDRRHKRMIEQIAEAVRGVDDVHNQIRVQRPEEATKATAPTTSGTTGAQGPRMPIGDVAQR